MFLNLFILSLPTAAISFGVTETKFTRSLREWMKQKNRLLGELFSCGYCFGHWVALVLVALYRPRMLSLWRPADFVLTVFAVAWLAAFQWLLMCLLMQKTAK
jgi:hypothetical protein